MDNILTDTDRLNWLQEHPEFTLRKRKSTWTCAKMTNYPYNAYFSLRAAIDAAINNTWQDD